MRKILTAAVLVLAFAFSGCSQGGKDVDVTGLADALRNQITYKDDLSQIDMDTAGMFYSFGDADITDSVFYESSGATAEEIVVIKCGSSAGAEAVEGVLKGRVEEQKEAYTDYVPAELEKLNAAVVVRSGNSVVLSVSDDPQGARKIIDSYCK